MRNTRFQTPITRSQQDRGLSAHLGRLLAMTGRAAARGRSLALTLLLPLILLGCDSLLDVELPGSVEADDLANPGLANTLVDSAVGQFECSLTSYVVSVGTLSSELINTSSFLNLNPWGWRGLELETITGGCPSGRNATAIGAYSPLQQARYLSEEAFELISDFPADEVPNRDEQLATLAAYAAYSYTLLGEGFCEMAIDQGPLITPSQVFQDAEVWFDQAISLAESAGSVELRDLALVGRARVRLNLGDMNGAAQDADRIPEGFVWYSEYSTIDGRRENRIYNLNRRNRNLGVDWRRYADLQVGGVSDPRVPVEDSGELGSDNQSPHWYQLKFPSAETDIRMASWEEAQLILAEARPAEAVDAVNRLRAAQGLPAVDGSDPADPLELVLEERRRELFLEGHRYNDMLRHGLEFPPDENHKGQSYGPITCMPLPDQERQNNPNISG